MTDTILETQRLLLRRWREEDRAGFAALNADPRVMAFLSKKLDRQESGDLAARIDAKIAERGYGLYAVEVKETGEFIGFTGLKDVAFEAAFTPAVEIGWRLAFDHWGKGYATEAARVVAGHAFEVLGMEELVSFTVPANKRSRRVMEKLGMMYCPEEEFMHPQLPEGHRLARHVVYRLGRGGRGTECP